MQLNLGQLKTFCDELKHVFAPVEQHASHIACVALDTLCKKLEEKGIETINHMVAPTASNASAAVPEGFIPAEFKPLFDTILAKVLSPRSCIDCLTLSGTQLRDLLNSRGPVSQAAAKYVSDAVEYPMSIDLLLQLCSPMRSDTVPAVASDTVPAVTLQPQP